MDEVLILPVERDLSKDVCLPWMITSVCSVRGRNERVNRKLEIGEQSKLFFLSVKVREG